MTLVPTLKVVGLTEVQKRAFVLADNKIAENAGWDREILVKELGELAKLFEPLNLDLSLTGFEPAELDAMLEDLGTGPDPSDSVPAIQEPIVTRPSDLWILGSHRLLCGDARSQQALDRLMEGSSSGARAAFLDVPYNVRVADVQGRGRIKHPEFVHASGEMDKPQYLAFLEEAFGNAARVSADGAVHYICNDWRHIVDLITAAEPVYGEMLNLVVWGKTNAGQGSFYRSQHELIGVFRVGHTQHRNNVQLGRFGRNRSNLWTYAGINTFGKGRLEHLSMHPTVKPVRLIADAMRDCTTKGDIVLDTFAGSGSTIMAGEKVGRRVRAMELELRYVDVAVRRWEAHTKSEAVLDGDGRTFAEVRAARLASGSPSKTAESARPSHQPERPEAPAQTNDDPLLETAVESSVQSRARS
jgi:DNA modification methylase